MYKTKKFKVLLKSLLVLALFAVSLEAFSAWTAPTAAPPNDNTQSPLNVGGATQQKTGGIVVGGLRSLGTNIFDTSAIIGEVDTPDASSVLDLRSTTKGLLAPRMTEAQKDAISSPATGLVVYQTNGTAGFYYYDGSAWLPLGGGGGLPAGSNNDTLRYDGSDWVANDVIYNDGSSVGIGTTPFIATLTVDGSQVIRGTGNSYLLFYNTNSGFEDYSIGANFNGFNVYDSSVGQTRMVIDEDGNMGVGTTSPTERLHVSGDVRVSGLSGSTGCIEADTNGVLSNTGSACGGGGSGPWDENGTNVYLVTNSNDVGIGTNNPTSKLDIVDVVGSNGVSVQTQNDAFLGLHSTTLGQEWRIFTHSGTGDLRFYDVNQTSVRMTLERPTGNFGIGDSSPNSLLTVGPGDAFQVTSLGEITSSDLAGAGTSCLEVDNNGTISTTGSACGGGGSGPWEKSGSNVYLSTLTDNVGIGTATPGQALDVHGFIRTRDNGSGQHGILFNPEVGGQHFGQLNYFNGNGMLFVSGGSNRMVIKTDGKVGIGNTSPAERFSVGSSSQFRVDNTGDIVRINNVAYTWPSSQGGADEVLTNDGSGNLTWEPGGGGGGLPSGTAGQTLRNTGGTTWVANSTLFNDGTNIGIGGTPQAGLHIKGSRDFLIDNNRAYQAKNSAGIVESFLWPRADDNITYLNYGNSGFRIRNNNSSDVIHMTSGMRVGVRTNNPTAYLHLGTTNGSFNTAPLKFASGTLLGGVEDGAMEYDGNHLYFTIGSTRHQLDQQGGGGGGSSPWIENGGNVYLDTASNNVGIGTDSPVGKLEVVSQLRVGDSSGGAMGFIALNDNDATNPERIWIQTPVDVASTFTLTLPPDTGDNNEYLRTDGFGNLSWDTPGGGGLPGSVDDSVLLGDGTDWNVVSVPNCIDTGGNHLNYNTASNSFSCGTSGGGGGSLPSGTSGQTLRHNGSDWVATGTLFNNGTNVGIGDTSPAALLTVGASDAFQVDNNGRITSSDLAGQGTSCLQVNNSGVLSTTGSACGVGGGGDNLGNHIATQDLDLNNNDLFGSHTTGGDLTIESTSHPVKGDIRLALAGGNVGIDDPTPASLFTVGNGDRFQVNSSGDLIRIDGVVYNWPSTQGSADEVLTNDGTGNLTWEPGGGGGVGVGVQNFITKWDTATTLGVSLLYDNNSAVGVNSLNPPALFTVGSTNGFRVNNSGNLIRVNNVGYSWPSSQGSPDEVLTNDGSGNLTWEPAGGGGDIWDTGGSTPLGGGGQDVYFQNNNDYLGLGTNTPQEQLDLTASMRLTSGTTISGGVTSGAIFKGSQMFMHNAGIETTFLGLGAGNMSPGTSATAVGRNAMSSASGSWSTAVGHNALSQASGGSNTGVGYSSLSANTSGFANTAVGTTSLQSNGTGSNNVAVGASALLTNSSGSGNVGIGSGADTSGGGLSNAIAIGNGAVVNASNKVRIGDSGMTVYETQVAWTTGSDARFKKEIIGSDLGLDFIMSLRPVSYRLKNEDSSAGLSYGFIAQEVEAALDGKNTKIVNTQPDGENLKYMRYDDLFAPITKAIQEQQEQIEDLKKENKELKLRIEAIEAKLK